MPNYPTHARWGRIGAVVMALTIGASLFYLFETIPLAGGAALGAAAATFVGSVYPDIDHHNSIPRRKATRAFRLLVVLGILSLAVLGWDQLLRALESGLGAAGLDAPVPVEVVAASVTPVVAAVAALLVEPAIDVATHKHRGWTHSALVNVVLTALLGALVWTSTTGLALARRVAAIAVIGTFFVGALIHLCLDGELV